MSVHVEKLKSYYHFSLPARTWRNRAGCEWVDRSRVNGVCNEPLSAARLTLEWVSQKLAVWKITAPIRERSDAVVVLEETTLNYSRVCVTGARWITRITPQDGQL